MSFVRSLRNKLRPYYSVFRPIYVPLLCSAGYLPFEAFIWRAKSEARISKFHPRYPFALERGPAAQRLHQNDPNNRLGHEPELAHLLDLLVLDDGVFLDVGSNYGYFSIYLATRPSFRGRIHAFEPVASSYAGLREIVSSLQCDQIVTCHHTAASDSTGTANMDVAGDPGLASIKSGPIEQGEVVQTITLDSLNLPRVDFIKVDVEGHEAATLRGAERLIKTCSPYIFLESWTFPGQPKKVDEALRFLIALGYALYLPAWVQPDKSLFVGIGPTHEMSTFALVPFSLEDRRTFPSNPINVFASHKSRENSLGAVLGAGDAAKKAP
jgi:FkbM family methyltransferase